MRRPACRSSMSSSTADASMSHDAATLLMGGGDARAMDAVTDSALGLAAAVAIDAAAAAAPTIEPAVPGAIAAATASCGSTDDTNPAAGSAVATTTTAAASAEAPASSILELASGAITSFVNAGGTAPSLSALRGKFSSCCGAIDESAGAPSRQHTDPRTVARPQPRTPSLSAAKAALTPPLVASPQPAPRRRPTAARSSCRTAAVLEAPLAD